MEGGLDAEGVGSCVEAARAAEKLKLGQDWAKGSLKQVFRFPSAGQSSIGSLTLATLQHCPELLLTPLWRSMSWRPYPIYTIRLKQALSQELLTSALVSAGDKTFLRGITSCGSCSQHMHMLDCHQ